MPLLFSKRSTQGLAMLEVLIAILLISISIAGILTLYNYLMRSSINFQEYIQAVNIGNSEIESLRNYSTLTAQSGQFAYTDIIALDNTACSVLAAPYIINNTTYTCTLYVTSISNPGYLNIKVKVTWTNVTGQQFQQVELLSMIGQLDPNAKGQTIGT
jgi:Tfp pilus assembly protein PilV